MKLNPEPENARAPFAVSAAKCGTEPERTTIRRSGLIKWALKLEGITVAWMLTEAIMAIAAGLSAGVVALLAWGIDSVIELASAGVLIWRLSVELHGRRFAESIERTASRISGGLLFALAAYVVISAGVSLWHGQQANFSGAGLTISVLAVPIMYLLGSQKLKVAVELESGALRADAAEAIACGWLSLVVILDLLGQLLFHVWWLDPIASLAIVWFLLKEGHEAWNVEHCAHE